MEKKISEHSDDEETITDILEKELLGVLNVYKPFSCTPLEVVNQIKEKYPLYKSKKIGMNYVFKYLIDLIIFQLQDMLGA